MIGYGMEKKRGIISGGTSGIGLAAARLLVQNGAKRRWRAWQGCRERPGIFREM